MAISQVNASYIRPEDRILLRVTMTEGDEFRFWLTRASLRDFSPQVAAWSTPANATPAAVVQSFKREAAAAQADFATPLTPGERFPLGAAPVLIRSLRMEQEGKVVRLLLDLQDKRVVTLHLDEPALAGIQRLLQQACTAADWGVAALQPVAARADKIH